MSVVLVSGANRGLGALIALEFARGGHRVFAGARRPDDAHDLRTAALSAQLSLDVVALDVTSEASTVEAVDRVVASAGTLDVLVSNAGIGGGGPIELATDDAVRRLFEVNTFGTLRLIRAALPVMRAQRRGNIIAVGSLSGRVPSPGMGVYAASKQAVVAIVEALALEVEQFGIRVSCVEPGPYRTQITGATAPPPATSPYSVLMQALRARTKRRLAESGDPDEIGRASCRERVSCCV